MSTGPGWGDTWPGCRGRLRLGWRLWFGGLAAGALRLAVRAAGGWFAACGWGSGGQWRFAFPRAWGSGSGGGGGSISRGCGSTGRPGSRLRLRAFPAVSAGYRRRRCLPPGGSRKRHCRGAAASGSRQLSTSRPAMNTVIFLPCDRTETWTHWPGEKAKAFRHSGLFLTLAAAGQENVPVQTNAGRTAGSAAAPRPCGT